MAAHLADQIVEWVVEKLGGLATTGTNVFRGRSQEIPESSVPAIAVYMGPDEVIEDLNQFQDSRLSVLMMLYAKGPSEGIESTLARIRKEINVKLRAEFSNKLSEVQDYREAVSDRPDIEAGSNQPSATMLVAWDFEYRRSYDDPSV